MVVYINKLDSMLEYDMKDLVELEVRELLESYGFPGDLPVVKGSARKALLEEEISEFGDNVGVLVKGVKKDDAKRGYVLAAIDSIKAFIKFESKIYVLTKKEGGRHKSFTSNYKPQFFFRTANVTGTIILPEEVAVVL